MNKTINHHRFKNTLAKIGYGFMYITPKFLAHVKIFFKAF